MNLVYVHRLIRAAHRMPARALHVPPGEPDRQVRLITNAGLVEATLQQSG